MIAVSAPEPRRVAAIDIGTVTTRLLVADIAPGSIAEVARSTDITHLGEDLTRTGRLSGAAMGRVEEVVARYAAEIERTGADAVRAVATSASRDAANAGEFTAMLARHGIVAEVVSGATEARLAFAGATWGVDAEDVLVNDIGGGSTEIVLGSAGAEPRVAFARSVDVGSRRVTEVCLPSDPPAPAEFSAARAYVRDLLGPAFEALPAPPRSSIALAGTATTLVAIDLGLTVYDPARVHGAVLARDRVGAIADRLAAMPLSERLEVPGLHPGRAPVIVAGALILGELLDLAGLDSTVVSEHDILYGIAIELVSGLERGPGLM